jgi:hypothetical protein
LVAVDDRKGVCSKQAPFCLGTALVVGEGLKHFSSGNG